MAGRSGRGTSPVRIDLTNIAALLDRFQLDYGRYPTTEEGLTSLTVAPLALERRWRGPYTKQPIGNDPWGTPYHYEAQGKGYVITSLGADGKPGGEGENADIVAQG